MIDCERWWTTPQKVQCKTATNVLWFGECLCLRHYKHLYSWESTTQTICIPVSFGLLQWSHTQIQTILPCGKHCKKFKLGLFQDSNSAGDIEDSKSTSGGTLCSFGSHTFVPISWMCQKQNLSFTQFNRIRNHLVERSIEIGRESRSRFVVSNSFSRWKQDSEPW